MRTPGIALDTSLRNMMDSMEQGNHWAAGQYAAEALAYIDDGGKLNSNAEEKDVEELRAMIIAVRDEANRRYNHKNDLINQIVNFDGTAQ